jgi:hypothetical protein
MQRRSLRHPVVLAGLVLGLTLGVSHAAAPPPAGPASELSWTIQRADAPKSFFGMDDRSLRLDADGHPHIAYGGDALYYARHDVSGWHLQIVDAKLGVGADASLALDAASNPSISYLDGLNVTLNYARWTGSA